MMEEDIRLVDLVIELTDARCPASSRNPDIDRLAAANVKNVSLTNFDVIAEEAAKEGYIRPEDISRLIRFRNDPADESWRM